MHLVGCAAKQLRRKQEIMRRFFHSLSARGPRVCCNLFIRAFIHAYIHVFIILVFSPNFLEESCARRRIYKYREGTFSEKGQIRLPVNKGGA